MRTIWFKGMLLAGSGVLLAVPVAGCMNAMVQRVLVALAV